MSADWFGGSDIWTHQLRLWEGGLSLLLFLLLGMSFPVSILSMKVRSEAPPHVLVLSAPLSPLPQADLRTSFSVFRPIL